MVYPFPDAYSFNEVDKFFDDINNMVLEVQIRSSHLSYFNIPCSFDIETTSIYDDRGSKFAFMYIWQFGFNGLVIYGRTWEEYDTLISRLVKELYITQTKRLCVYVHNLGYEFQFIRKRIEWAKDKNGNDVVFSLKKRRPIYALDEHGIEYRCSYFLSNVNLGHIGAEMLFKYPVPKMIGDLDYRLVRTRETPLTDKEIGYCVNDVRVVMSYIQEKIESEGGIINLPLTNTGYVRKFTRAYCNGLYELDERMRRKRSCEYHSIMKALRIKSKGEYYALKQAFAGGFTHASPTKSRWGSYENGTVLPYWKNVGSADLASSYPYTMVSSYFPMSSCEYIGKVEYPEQFSQLISKFCCLFRITFKGLYQLFEHESYISVSKCIELSDDYISQNGRLCEAATCSLYITELDFDIISRVYDWTEIFIDDMRCYQRGYLPRPFIMSILELYSAKTTLKGVPDKAVEYLVKKGMLNSAYGMAVTDIVRDDAIYSNGEWDSLEADSSSQLVDYNNGYQRFLFYPWGVWVTAHARHNLWDAIFEFGEDYIYADTDSIKGVNFESHMGFFNKYNASVRVKLASMCAYYHIPAKYTRPKNQKGESVMIGVWDIEEPYVKFRTIGAKRYLYQYSSGVLGLTVSGVNKYMALPYMIHKYCGVDYELCKMAYTTDERLKEERKKALSQLVSMNINYDPVFEAFDESLLIPKGFSGKLTHTYVDKEYAAFVTDYVGNRCLVHEKSYTHLEPAEYNFSISATYLEFLILGKTTQQI